jgi:hypothetical protein
MVDRSSLVNQLHWVVGHYPYKPKAEEQFARLERGDVAVAQPSRSSSLFNRVIQTSGDSASSHHALGALADL